jgi:hypothetical protein
LSGLCDDMSTNLADSLGVGMFDGTSVLSASKLLRCVVVFFDSVRTDGDDLIIGRHGTPSQRGDKVDPLYDILGGLGYFSALRDGMVCHLLCV